ncbi:hypothetical protein HAX54_045370 [Datura stramonium]|uniref:Uncharacterized protein n=1 Tax=Datura stramonium TaxID=4076 RepID=A0ABS8SQ68_DATST|nr:hypothetical protein [Datura stramonium]
MTSRRPSLLVHQSRVALRIRVRKKRSPTQAESNSDPEFEEALRKTKKDEERRAELRCKRGEDALRFNDIPGMKEKFFEGTQIRNFNEEKQFSLNRIEQDFPDILRQIEKRYWQIFTLLPGRLTPSKNDNEIPMSQAILIACIMTGVHMNVGDVITFSVAQMVQVANMMARNNTKLSSLIDHMPEMIKRAIDKALAPVHIKIQDLEHRVSALEEDDDFEDERAETNEENFEDAQIVKEVDEDQESGGYSTLHGRPDSTADGCWHKFMHFRSNRRCYYHHSSRCHGRV